MLHYQMSASQENRIFANAKTKAQISFAVTAKLISAFVFATRIVHFLFLLNPKFQASMLLGHVGMLPPFYRTFTQNEDVITSNKCLKYNYPTKTQKAYTYGWFDLKCFLGRLRQARLTSIQSAVYLALPEGTSSLYLFL